MHIDMNKNRNILPKPIPLSGVRCFFHTPLRTQSGGTSRRCAAPRRSASRSKPHLGSGIHRGKQGESDVLQDESVVCLVLGKQALSGFGLRGPGGI